MSIKILTQTELQFIADQFNYGNKPEYIKASEIAYEIKCRYGEPCSAQKVNQVLLKCFGNTTLSDRWEIPLYVPPLLYQWNGSVYEWHRGLIAVVYDQLFGNQNPLELGYAISQILDNGN